MTPKPTPRTGGRLVVDALRTHGVTHVFGVAGESYLDVLDAFVDVAEIRFVTCRQEGGAANMAEAHAKLTGRPGVCIVTRGPGACNASIGVHTAFQDSTPMLLLVGQVARGEIGREAFQEVDFRQMYGPLAKSVEQVDSAARVPEVVQRALHLATSGRPGPVVVVLPEDMLADTAAVADAPPYQAVRPAPTPDRLAALRRLLAGAERPLMLVGGGGWSDEAAAAVARFATANTLPVCCSFRRHDIVDNDLPCFVGELGLAPSDDLKRRVRESDLLLVVGARLGEMTTQGYSLLDVPDPGKVLIHVHPGADEIGRVFRPSLAVPSGVNEFAAALSALEPARDPPWADWAAAARAGYEDSQTAPPPGEGSLDLAAVMQALGATLPDDSVVTVDAGNFSGWPQRYLRFRRPGRLLGPTSGAMGYSVPAGVSAKITEPQRTVVSCVGDGGFLMTGQELATALHHGAAPIILVFNNNMFGTIRMHQERRFPGRVSGTRLTNPDFAALARCYGAHGESVSRTEEFAPALERALAAGIAAVIELRMDPDVISTRTTLSALRAAAEGTGKPAS